LVSTGIGNSIVWTVLGHCGRFAGTMRYVEIPSSPALSLMTCAHTVSRSVRQSEGTFEI
jgi:hypothetical protein